MNFLDPLGLIGLSALVPIVVLYFLKLKREQRVVPSTLLWKKVIEDMQVNSPFQRLKYSLLLLLQILLIGLIGFALARPYLNLGGVPGKQTVLLIDTSASMATRDAGSDGKQTRLEAAIRDAQQKANDLRQGDEMALIAFDREARPLCKFSSDRDMLKTLLGELKVRDLETRGDDAFEAAIGMIQGKPNTEVLVLSDGCFDDVKLEKERAAASTGNLEDTKAQTVSDRLRNFRFVGYGSEISDNAGITQMNQRTRRVKRKDADGKQIEEDETVLFLTVENFSPAPRDVVLSISTASPDGSKYEFPMRVISLKGHPPRDESGLNEPPKDGSLDLSKSDEILKLPADTKGTVTARIASPKDKFPNDDVASVVIEGTENGTVLFVSKGNFFFEKALDAMARQYGWKWKKVDPDEFMKDWEQKGQQAVDTYDVCIFDRLAPLTWTDGGALFLGVMPPIAGFVKLPKEKQPPQFTPIIDWDSSHPLMRYVTFGNVTVKTAEAWQVPKAAKTLVEGPGFPFVVAYEADRLRAIGVAFDIFDTDWPSRPSLPLFCHNALPWLAKASPRQHPSAQRTGEPLAIPPGLGNGIAEITKPDGSVEKVQLSREHTTLVKGTEYSGLYQVKIPGEDKARVYAFNLSSRNESDNATRAALKIGDVALESQPALMKAKREIWRWLALAAAVLLLGEWWVYHRRVGM
ncbi:MAG TPA: BatA and WFA domain-containing protein [Planctomycetota bacterium]|nr:BatA and WFA domain-containing protein [Planctomycetota bacterium]